MVAIDPPLVVANGSSQPISDIDLRKPLTLTLSEPVSLEGVRANLSVEGARVEVLASSDPTKLTVRLHDVCLPFTSKLVLAAQLTDPGGLPMRKAYEARLSVPVWVQSDLPRPSLHPAASYFYLASDGRTLWAAAYLGRISPSELSRLSNSSWEPAISVDPGSDFSGTPFYFTGRSGHIAFGVLRGKDSLGRYSPLLFSCSRLHDCQQVDNRNETFLDPDLHGLRVYYDGSTSLDDVPSMSTHRFASPLGGAAPDQHFRETYPERVVMAYLPLVDGDLVLHSAVSGQLAILSRRRGDDYEQIGAHPFSLPVRLDEHKGRIFAIARGPRQWDVLFELQSGGTFQEMPSVAGTNLRLIADDETMFITSSRRLFDAKGKMIAWIDGDNLAVYKGWPLVMGASYALTLNHVVD